ncbi:anaerobic ribonucleoside-triphosphate reductase [Dethiosulfovibrio salsuginis]|nr:anaerobic ribonucleoside-triphosphate reductase [Dethiosulfovibrio salsuginis]
MSVMKEDNRTRCEVYSRVVGFLSPVSQWNKGKKEEFSDRLTFDRSTGQETVKKA